MRKGRKKVFDLGFSSRILINSFFPYKPDDMCPPPTDKNWGCPCGLTGLFVAHSDIILTPDIWLLSYEEFPQFCGRSCP